MLKGRQRSRKSPLKQRSERGTYELVLSPEPLRPQRPTSPVQTSLSPCPLHSSRNWQDRRNSGLRWGYPLKNKALAVPPVHSKAQSLLSLEVVQPRASVRVKTTDIKVPSFRKRLFRYVEKCSYSKKTERRGAVEAMAYVSARQYRLDLVRASLDSPLLHREDACVGNDDPLPMEPLNFLL